MLAAWISVTPRTERAFAAGRLLTGHRTPSVEEVGMYKLTCCVAVTVAGLGGPARGHCGDGVREGERSEV